MKSLEAFLIPCQVVSNEVEITPGTFTLVMRENQPVRLFDEDQKSQQFWVVQVSDISAPSPEDIGVIKRIISQFLDSADIPVFLVTVGLQGQMLGVIHPDDIKDLWLTLQWVEEEGTQEFGPHPIKRLDEYPEVGITVWICPLHPSVPPYISYQLGTPVPPCPIGHEPREPLLKLLQLRLDVAVPDKVYVDQVFDLAIAIRQWTSSILNENDLPIIKSGKVQVQWPASQPSVRLRLQVSAPTCKVVGKESCSFSLWFNQDSPIFSFQLIPKEEGEISIIVTVFQEDDSLGTARIHTIASQVAGRVQIETISQPLKPSIPKSKSMESLERQLYQRWNNLWYLKEQATMYPAGELPLELHNRIEKEEEAIEELRNMTSME